MKSVVGKSGLISTRTDGGQRRSSGLGATVGWRTGRRGGARGAPHSLTSRRLGIRSCNGDGAARCARHRPIYLGVREGERTCRKAWAFLGQETSVVHGLVASRARQHNRGESVELRVRTVNTPTAMGEGTQAWHCRDWRRGGVNASAGVDVTCSSP